MDSNETLLEWETSADNGQEQNNQKIIIDWQEVDIEELKKGYLRQNDYTKKTQELAKEREALKWKPEVDETDEYLQQKGYIKKDDLQTEIEKRLARERDEYKLDKLIESNPQLQQHAEAIRKIATVDNSALEDIIVKYNFLSSDKLSKAKQRDIVGWGAKEEKTLDIDSMTSEQWEAYKAKNGIGRNAWLSRARNL